MTATTQERRHHSTTEPTGRLIFTYQGRIIAAVGAFSTLADRVTYLRTDYGATLGYAASDIDAR